MSEKIRYIDTHAHLQAGQFADDRDATIERAAAAGVARMIEIGYDLPSSHAAVALAAAHPQIYAVVGVQPNHIADAPPDWLDEVRWLATQPKVVAIGEIGLDYYWNKASPAAQEASFRAQLALARELALPVVIHSRDAQADMVRILQDAAQGQAGIMHSFMGGWAFAEACLEVGFMLSLSGPLTFRRNAELHDVARRAPLEMLLSETDSPYLTPDPHRGRRNEPAYIPLVTQQLAALRGIGVAEAAAALWANAERVFRFDRY
jgi:TatD DNase family protein